MSVITHAWSQPRLNASPRPQLRSGRMMARMGEDLNLSAAQKTRMKAVRDASLAQFRVMNGKTGLSPDQKRAQTTQIMRAMRTKMDAILTPAQRQKRASLRLQADAEQKKRRYATIDRNAKLLNMTPQQTSRMKAAVESSIKQRKAIRENASLQPEQRRARTRQISQAMRAQMEAILTPAQRQKMATLRQQRRNEAGARMNAMQGARPAMRAATR